MAVALGCIWLTIGTVLFMVYGGHQLASRFYPAAQCFLLHVCVLDFSPTWSVLYTNQVLVRPGQLAACSASPSISAENFWATAVMAAQSWWKGHSLPG